MVLQKGPHVLEQAGRLPYWANFIHLGRSQITGITLRRLFRLDGGQEPNILRQGKADFGLPDTFTIHGLRHTAATILQKDCKVDITTTMGITGRKSVEMLKGYSHADDAAKRVALNAINSVLAPDARGARRRNCALIGWLPPELREALCMADH